jgi:hypothetical protein
MPAMNDTSSALRAPLRAAIALAVLSLIPVACASAGSAGWTYAPLGPTPTPGASASAEASGSPAASGTPTVSGSPGTSGSPAGNVIELEETANLQILQAGQPVTVLSFTVGQTYTFHINNSAGFDHDFYLGPPDKLQANTVDGLPGVPVNTQGTQEFTWTASADAQGWEFACTVPGHYTNMHGTVMLAGQ